MTTPTGSVDMADGDGNGDYILADERKLEWSHLRRKCRNLELEQYYESYLQRLRLSYLSLFVFINAAVTGAHLVLLLSTVPDTRYVLVDIVVYVTATVVIWIVLLLNFRDHMAKHKNLIMYGTSWISIFCLVASDMSILVYHSVTNHYILRPSYASYSLYAIYIFMPLPQNVHAFILGITVTVSYLLLNNYITYRKLEHGVDQMDTNKLISESTFLFCINIFGIFFRLMKEIAIRTTFLDRRQCVEENLLLRYARDQEKNLLLSIIPAQIANKIEQDVKMRIEQMKLQSQFRTPFQPDQSEPPPLKRWRQPDTEKLFIEPHNDVSILYADVVNYTYLTTTLDVRTLVETLHDLFAKFDMASQEFNVLRIKFLGDCYYCVAGVPIPNEYHARCCVELGLRMIKDIQEVRTKRSLNIDMRIGVHSGNILSGVIGACKWQFDIWSKDVDIANRLEQTGQAGRVHVSEQTLKLLEDQYTYEEGTKEARVDPILRKYRIRTFLIQSSKSNQPIVMTKRFQMLNRRTLEIKPRTEGNFVQNTIIQYNQIRTQAKLEMNREMDKMPIGRIQFTRLCLGRNMRLTQDELEEQSFRSNITSCCLFFRDWRWELSFMEQPDDMFKYSLLCSLVTFITIVMIQAVNEPQSVTFWIVGCVNFMFILLVLLCGWYKKLWLIKYAATDVTEPMSKLSRFLYKSSETIQKTISIRIGVYLLLMTIFSATTLLQLLDCDRTEAENLEIEIQLFNDGERGNLCFNPWAITESIMITICMVFLFTRIPFVLKLAVGVLIFGLYAIIVLFEYDFIYEKSPTTNVGLYTEYSHLLVLVLTLCIFHLVDRQTEFISKVDYNWNRQLQKKQDDAKFTNETIKILVQNILPSHVADIYMTKTMQNELYFEEYDNVAVMFATIKNYDTEKVGLRVLNEIICDFDAVLHFYKGPMKVEKIKVAGWTYMAACGLDVGSSEIASAQGVIRGSTILPNGRRSQHPFHRSSREKLAAISKATAIDPWGLTFQMESQRPESRRTRHKGTIVAFKSSEWNNVTYVMAQFALDLMRTMHAFNMENLQYEDVDKERAMLRIGISSGEIMAGVVGSYKPHYDIWGNPVNMASRMDSTGVPGNIQVTEDVANVLQSFNIKCVKRGLTYVKGRGEIPTYFIAIDKDLNFIKLNSEETFHLPRSERSSKVAFNVSEQRTSSSS